MDAVYILTSIVTSAAVTGAIVAIAQKLIISKVETRQQKELEAVKAQLNRHYQEEIEVIKSKLVLDLERLKNANSNLSGVYLSSNQERVAALKSAWELHLKSKELTPHLITIICNLLTKKNALNIKTFNGSSGVKEMVKNFNDTKYFDGIITIIKEIEKLKPFIGLELWGLLSTYTSIIFRITLETGQVLLKDSYEYYWLDDEHLINNIILKIMTHEKFVEVVNNGKLLKGLLDYIELEIVEHINSQLTGKIFSVEQVQLAAQIQNGANFSKTA